MQELFIIFSNTGHLVGFYEEEEVVKKIIEKNQYCKITKDMRDQLLGLLNPNDPILCVDKISDSDTVIDNMEFILQPRPKERDLEREIQDQICQIKATCAAFIVHGLSIPLESGETKAFSFSLEDQINLQEILLNYQEGDSIFYHANGEEDKIYSYEQIQKIYKDLCNNKRLNQIYTQVLCEWIQTHDSGFIDEDGNLVTYGYCNHEILKEVNKRYELQKLL